MSDLSSHVADQLSHYIDGQLDDVARGLVEEHLQACETCRQHFEELNDVRAAMRATPIIDPPETLYENVLQQIQEPPPPAPRFAFMTGFPAKALASACVVMLVVWVTRETRRDNAPVVMFHQAETRNEAKKQDLPVKTESEQATGGKSLDMTSSNQILEPQAPSLKVAAKARSSDLKDLDQAQRRLASVPTSKPLSERTDVTLQARDTGGVASQNSFERSKNAQLAAPVTLPVDGVAGSLSRKRVESPVLGARPGSAPVSAVAPASMAAIEEQLEKKATKSLSDDKETLDLRAPKGNPFSAGELPEWRGLYSGIKQFRTVAIRSTAEWGKAWREQTGTQAPAPQVNFNEYMIVGVYAGEKPAGGTVVEIFNTEEVYPPALIVHYREVPPTAPAKTSSAIQPFHLWVIPQSVLPVKFKKQ